MKCGLTNGLYTKLLLNIVKLISKAWNFMQLQFYIFLKNMYLYLKFSSTKIL